MTISEGSTHEASRVSLKRDIGWFGSFAMGYADVGADIYVALGLVAAYAAGWAPVAFLVASITYIATGLAYAELATAYPYAGGAQVYSMKAFNDFAGFLAGWLVMLDYIVCIALFAIATTGYLSLFFPFLLTSTLAITIFGVQLSISAVGTVSFAIVLLLIGVNIVGIKESSNLNMIMVALNIGVLSIVMVLGLLTTFRFDLFVLQVSVIGAPEQYGHIAYIWTSNISEQNLLYAITLAMSSFIGIESIAQAAEETKRPDRTIPRATKMSIVSVLIFAIGLSAISLGVLEWTFLRDGLEAPVLALVERIALLGSVLLPVVAFTGFAICLVSSNTGVIGVSRVVFSMSNFGLLPEWFSKVHPKTRTPVRTILVFGMIGGIMALVGELGWVADLYNFGALLSYLMVNVSLVVLRHSDREAHRSWTVPFTVKLRLRGGTYELPLPSLIGIIACSSIWALVVIFHPMGRLLGILWTLAGLVVYVTYRTRKHLPLFSRELGKKIAPMTYKLNAVVLIRPEEREEVALSIQNSIDTRFRLTLLSIIRIDQAPMALATIKEYQTTAESDLEEIAKPLKATGFEVTTIAEVGQFERVLTDKAISPNFDFVIILKTKGHKKKKQNGQEDPSSIVTAVAPGKLMLVRK